MWDPAGPTPPEREPSRLERRRRRNASAPSPREQFEIHHQDEIELFWADSPTVQADNRRRRREALAQLSEQPMLAGVALPRIDGIVQPPVRGLGRFGQYSPFESPIWQQEIQRENEEEEDFQLYLVDSPAVQEENRRMYREFLEPQDEDSPANGEYDAGGENTANEG